MHAHTVLVTVPQTNEKVLQHIDRYRMECPDGCPDQVYSIMRECWEKEPMQRPNFTRVYSLLQRVKELPESNFLSLSLSLSLSLEISLSIIRRNINL